MKDSRSGVMQRYTHRAEPFSFNLEQTARLYKVFASSAGTDCHKSFTGQARAHAYSAAMAKIFETRQDLTRDQLSQQLAKARHGLSFLQGSVVISSFFAALADWRTLLSPQTVGREVKVLGKAYGVGLIASVANVVLLAAALIGVVGKHRQVARLESALQQLGPEEVVVLDTPANATHVATLEATRAAQATAHLGR